MGAEVVSRNEDMITVQIQVRLCKSMLECEGAIQDALNEAGVVVTGEALARFDADGSPIVVGDVKFTSKGKVPKAYQSPYGEVRIERHVYQTSKGGRIYCPLENSARIVSTSTPRFAKILSSKYADGGSQKVMRDLEENHGRKVVRSFVQNVAELVGLVAIAKEETWRYEIPETDRPVATISIGMDGTCMLLCEDGWRETMVGTLSYYDREGNRLHTTYASAIPEYGKSTFILRMEEEVAQAKKRFPGARYIGLADGAKGNWEFLEAHTDVQAVDFWHAASYLGKAAEVMFKGKANATAQKEWLDDACHRLKTVHGAASRLLHEMEDFNKSGKLTKEDDEKLQASITYFTNQKPRMKFAKLQEENLPIGSGVTEAACKIVVKQRLCNSGMRWAKSGAAIVLSLRCLTLSENRWEQFWKKIDQYGLSLAA